MKKGLSIAFVFIILCTQYTLCQEKWDYKVFRGHLDEVKTIAISSDSKYIASGGADNLVKLWDVNTGLEIRTLSGHNKWVNSVNFMADNITLVSGSSDGTVKIWNLETGDIIKEFNFGEEVKVILVLNDNKTIFIAGNNGKMGKWNYISNLFQAIPKINSSTIYTAALSPDNSKVAVGYFDSEKNLSIFDIESGKLLKEFQIHESEITDVAFSADGKKLLATYWDGYAVVFDTETGKAIKVMSPPPLKYPAYSCCFINSNDFFLSRLEETAIRDLSTGRINKDMTDLIYYVNDVVLSPDSKRILVCLSRTVALITF